MAPAIEDTPTAVLAAALIATASTAAPAARRRASSLSAAALGVLGKADAAAQGTQAAQPAKQPDAAEPPVDVRAEEALVEKIRKVIPADCWHKDTLRSLGFLLQDVSILVALYAVYPAVPRLLVVPWILVTGFFMWCLFVVGHDCGHSTFSPYPLLNSIIGNLSHGFLGVPFQPWANSHAVHHRYHQHVEWDVSHPWFIEDHYEPRTRFELVLYWIPLLAYHLYLIGVGDGSHFVPWVGSIGLKDGVKSKAVHRGDLRDWISTASALAIPAAFWYLWAQGSWSAFFVGYLCPLMIFNAWLTIVTYLQHHSESVRAWKDTFSGSDSKAGWTFAAGALETVDRTYGWPIDDLSHNITDAHLVHHLFAREIPHYRLREATDAIAAAGVAKGHKRVEEIPYVGFILSYYKILWACRLMVKGANEAEYVPVAMGGKKAQ